MNMVTVWVYILKCADGSYYAGKYQGANLDTRVAEYNARKHANAYTARRLPVELVWSEWFSRFDDAVAFERRLKGWSRAKKQALIRGDEAALKAYSKRGFRPSLILRDGVSPKSETPPQDEERVCGNDQQSEIKSDLHPEEPSTLCGEGVTKGARQVRNP